MKGITVLAVALLLAGLLPAQTIYDIQFNDSNQGSGNDCYPSPYYQDEVTVTGVVTAVLPGQYPDFWLQEKSGDLWAGVFVYDVSVDPAVGDTLTLTAEVDEYYGLTELKNVSEFEIHGTAELPGISDISTADLAGGCNSHSEQFEGMLVRVKNVVVTQETNQYGEWYVADTSGVECQIDDYMYHYDATVGESLPAIIGIVHYSYGEYEINPRDEGDVGVEESSVQPVRSPFALYGVSPNPASRSAEVVFEMPRAGRVSLRAYDASGRLVGDIYSGHCDAGQHRVLWNTDGVDPGVYFIAMRADGFEATRPVVIAR